MTNFEKIKQMTIDEMANWLQYVISDCYYCPFKELCDDCDTCYSGIMKRLKSEAQE